MATFKKRYAKWHVRVRKNNKVITKTFVSKKNAIRWSKEIELQIEKGAFEDLTEANTKTLKDVLIHYLNKVTMNKKGWYSESYKVKKLCRHEIVNTKLSKLTALKIIEFQDELLETLNPSTVNKYIILINVAIKYARQILGIYLPSNPCEFIKRLKEPEFKGEVIELEEEKILLEKAELSKAPWLKLGIILGIDCGLRRGEIIKFKRQDIDFNKSTVLLRDTKNGTSRTVGLSRRAIEEIKKLPVSIDGRVVNCLRPDTFNFYWQQLKKWTGINKRFHSTRHTFATRASMNGWSITEISAQGGWKDLKVLKRYTHISAEHLAKKLTK